ncbi:MAG: pYEATS domain-containing protein [Alphaproteobacteria bacterium]
MTALVEAAEREIRVKIGELEQTIQDEGDALSKRVKQIRIAMTAPAEAKRAEDRLPKAAVDCDPNNLNSDQTARVAVQQLSEGTGNFVQDGRFEVFNNTMFLDVRGADETISAAVEVSCILDGVDRVVYGADPNWYKPSEFVSIDRENEFHFSISGWGPTELSAQIYFIGRRDPLRIQGNLTMTKAARADKRYLGEAPPGDL